MRLLIIASAALPLTAAMAQPAATPAPSIVPKTMKFVQVDPEGQCPKPLVYRDGPDESPPMRNLADLPPADAYHAVLRLDDKGCLDPVMVGYQYGR